MAVSLYNDVQLCREMHWTEADLYTTSEDFVWVASTILSLEGARQKRETKKGGGTQPPSAAYRAVEIPELPPKPSF